MLCNSYTGDWFININSPNSFFFFLDKSLWILQCAIRSFTVFRLLITLFIAFIYLAKHEIIQEQVIVY